MRSLKIIYVFLVAALFDVNVTFADIQEKWQEVAGNFVLKKATREDAQAPRTVVARLIELSGKTVNDVVDADGKTIEFFAVTYRVPANLTGKASKKTKLITQYGLYRTLDADLRGVLSKHVSPMLITVRYDVDNTTSFKFVQKNTVYTTPLLVMDN